MVKFKHISINKFTAFILLYVGNGTKKGGVFFSLSFTYLNNRKQCAATLRLVFCPEKSFQGEVIFIKEKHGYFLRVYRPEQLFDTWLLASVWGDVPTVNGRNKKYGLFSIKGHKPRSSL